MNAESVSASSAARQLLGLNLIMRVTQVIAGIAFIRFLTPAEYGLLGIVLTAASALNSLTDAGLSPMFVQRADAPSRLEQERMRTTNLILTVGLLVTVGPVAAVALEPDGLTGSVALLCGFAASMVLNSLDSAPGVLLDRARSFRARARIDFAAAMCFLAVAAPLLMLGDLGLAAFGVASLTSSLLRTTIFLRVTGAGVALAREPGELWRLLLQARYYQGSALVYVLNALSVAAIMGLAGLSAAGLYAVTQRLVEPANQLMAVLQRLSFPVMAREELPLTRSMMARRAANISIVLAVILVTPIVVVAPTLVRLVAGADFADASDVVLIVAVTAVILQPVEVLSSARLLALGDGKGLAIGGLAKFGALAVGGLVTLKVMPPLVGLASTIAFASMTQILVMGRRLSRSAAGDWWPWVTVPGLACLTLAAVAAPTVERRGAVVSALAVVGCAIGTGLIMGMLAKRASKDALEALRRRR